MVNWIIGIGFILILLFLTHLYRRQQRVKKLKAHLQAQWGQAKTSTFFDFEVIALYFKAKKNPSEHFHHISDQTSRDLDLQEVFKFIDRTVSKIGQQFLYYKLRTIDTIEQLQTFDNLSELFYKHADLRFNCQLVLSKLNTYQAYDLVKLIAVDNAITKPKFFKYVYISSVLSVALFIFSIFQPLLLLGLAPIFVINSYFHYKNKGNIAYYISAIDQLSKALKAAKALSAYHKLDKHFSDVSFIEKLNAITSKAKFIAWEKDLGSEFAFLFWFFLELFKIQFLVEYIVFFNLIDSIIKEKDNINKLFEYIGNIDSAISVASLKADKIVSCTPQFNTNNCISTQDVIHPLVKNCVPNTIALNNRSLLLTGSNMSGKTTFIRLLAINTILAQTLYICFARSFSIPFFKVFSSIRVTDNVMEGASYYLQEVLTIKKLIEAAQDEQPCLFVLDEIFKGTNTAERIAAGKAVLSFLNKSQHTVLVATHDIELCESLQKENYVLYHFSESIVHEALHFDYKLKQGHVFTRNAIKILELYDFPPDIINEAKKRIEEI